MNVDRSYLPYKSAREYQDRKMAKWMGFFLSEHSTALHTKVKPIDFSRALSLDKKILLLNQLYTQGFKAIFTIITENQTKNITGVVDSIAASQVGIQTDQTHYFISINDILTMNLEEELDIGH